MVIIPKFAIFTKERVERITEHRMKERNCFRGKKENIIMFRDRYGE
jgi:hypothetical protein